MEPVDLGLGLLLAPAGGGELGLGGGRRLLGVGESGLLAGDVRLEGGERFLDFGVLGSEHVDLGGVVGPLLTDALAFLARVTRGTGGGARDRRDDGDGSDRRERSRCDPCAPHPRACLRHVARDPPASVLRPPASPS